MGDYLLDSPNLKEEDVGEHLSSLLLGDGERWLAVLHAFLDESGTSDDTPMLTVAGFYGNEQQWRLFRKLWKPNSSGFHARVSDAMFSHLSSAIISSEIHGIFITLHKQMYKVLATDHMKSFMGNPYALCAFQCVLSICEEVHKPTSFVLEQGQPNLSFVKGILEYMMDAGTACVSAVASAKREDFIELHPADCASHCASFVRDHEDWLQRLMDAKLLKHGHITEEIIRDIAPEATAIVNRAKNERLKAKRNR